LCGRLETINLTIEQYDLLRGSGIGDLRLTCHSSKAAIEISHGWKQLDYLRHKVALFPGHYCSELDRRVHPQSGAVYFYQRIAAHEDFFEFYCDLYWNDGKRSTRADQVYCLSDRALAYWYADDGSTHHSKRDVRIFSDQATFLIGINSTRDIIGIKEVLQKKFGKITLSLTGKGELTHRLSLDTEASRILGEAINPYLEEFLPSKVIRVMGN